MATIKLKKPAGKSSDPRLDRVPVRGAAAARKRPTLSEAQGARAEREARYQDQLKQRFGDAPPDSARRGPATGAPARKSAPRGPNPVRGGNDAFDPARGSHDAFDRTRRAPASPRPDPRDARPANRDDRNSTRDDRPLPRGTNNAGRDARPPSQSRMRDDRSPAPYRGTQDDGRAAPPPAPYFGPRDDGRASRPKPSVKTKTDAFHNNPAAPAKRSGPVPSPRANATARRNAALDRDDDDEDDRQHPEIPGSVRLSKRMSELGIASRREADEWIPKGWVRVDGRIVSELGSRVMPDQQITIDAKAKFVQSQKVTVLINKPIGYVSGQAEDGYEPASVLVTADKQWQDDQSGIRFLKEHLRFLAPAGRLDIDSTGLLVLTQDGRIAKQLIGEDRETEKEYLVRVQTLTGKPLPDASLQKLRHGLELDGEALLPATVEWINDDQLRFVLKEGKKRQIRRMCELVGLKVLGLRRVRIGKVMLGDLPPGTWRYLRLDEGFI